MINKIYQKKLKTVLIYSKFRRIYNKLKSSSGFSIQDVNNLKKIRIKTFFGEKMNVILPEVVSSYLYQYSFFEEGLTKMVLNNLKKDMVFFDIGTHYGYFSLLASKLVGGNGQVHSFEPTPSTFNILKENLGNKNNVFLNNIAVWSKESKMDFQDYGIKYSAFNSFYDVRLDAATLNKIKLKKYKIKTICIDKYVKEKKIIPNFIKIDAESAEFEIIKGMGRTIKKYHPIISIEVGDQDIKGVIKCKKIVQYLLNKRYCSFEYNKGKIRKHKIKNKYEYDNILFLPKK